MSSVNYANAWTRCTWSIRLVHVPWTDSDACVFVGQALRTGTAPPEQPVYERAIPDTDSLAAERLRCHAPQADHMQVSMADP